MVYYVGAMPCSDVLMHFGIPGMKWGFRRFQNEDGTRTEAGKARYRLKPISSYSKDDAKAGKSVFESTNKILGGASHLVQKSRNDRARQVNDEIKKMSDEEMRRRINRINLERQYAEITYSEKNHGRDKALSILDTTGSVVGIAAGVFGIAVSVKSLIEKK